MENELINEGKLTKEDVLKVFDYSEKEIDVYTKVVKSDLDIFRIIKLVEGLTPNLRVCREGQALKLRLKMVVIRGGLV